MNPKVLKDPYYKEIYEKGGEPALIEAGFFIDNAPDDFDPTEHANIKCTPILFMKDRLLRIQGKQMNPKPCILLSTGSFAPIHEGHVAMMEAAKIAVEKAGWDVMGGYLSPDHDEYINRKINERFYNIHTRIDLANKAVSHIDWLKIDPWAGLFMKHTINFTDILRRLEVYVKNHLHNEIPIFFVAGGDNVGFIKTFEKKGQCVIISRVGYESNLEKYKDVFDNERLILGYSNNNNSSTKVRKQRLVEQPKQITLLLRVEEDRTIDRQIISELQKHFKEVKPLYLREQKEHFSKFGQDVISLDPLLRGKHNIEISRFYDYFGMNMLYFKNRPGSKPFGNQVENIEPGVYSLFDDDIHSGRTMRYVSNFLEKQGIDIWVFNSFVRSKENEEVLDVRDFIYGEKHGGLVINGERYPYIFPFVNPYIRASIKDPITFSINIWEINIKHYHKLGNMGIVNECLDHLAVIRKYMI
jgi:nicotinic acid mononucleotide adenylyltransferase